MTKNIQFITPFKIKQTWRFSNIINIRYEPDIKKVKQSKLPLIIYAPYACLKTETRKRNRYNVFLYFKEHNKSVYIIERGSLPKGVFIDKNGFLANSSSYLEKNWNHSLNKKELNKINEYIKGFVNNNVSWEKQSNERINGKIFSKFKNKTKVFIPMQVWDDTSMILFCGWVKTMKNFQEIIRQIAKENDNIIFLVKNHPRCTKFKMENSKNIQIVDNYHYKDCIKNCDIVLTINSGIGLQAMLWNKPTIVVGESFYQFENINYKVNNKSGIRYWIHNAQKPNMKKVRRFIYWLKFKFYCECKGKTVYFVNFEHPDTNEMIHIKGDNNG